MSDNENRMNPPATPKRPPRRRAPQKPQTEGGTVNAAPQADAKAPRPRKPRTPKPAQNAQALSYDLHGGHSFTA